MSRRSEDHKADDIIPLSELDVSEGRRFQDDSIWGFFDRLRREIPFTTAKTALMVHIGP